MSGAPKLLAGNTDDYLLSGNGLGLGHMETIAAMPVSISLTL